MKQLPHWILTENHPSVYESESATVIEMVAKLYGAMNTMIDEYNGVTGQLQSNIQSLVDKTNALESDGSVTNNRLADDSVTTGKIKDGAIVFEHLSDDLIGWQYRPFLWQQPYNAYVTTGLSGNAPYYIGTNITSSNNTDVAKLKVLASELPEMSFVDVFGKDIKNNELTNGYHILRADPESGKVVLLDSIKSVHGELIVDETITTDKIKDGAITFDKLVQSLGKMITDNRDGLETVNQDVENLERVLQSQIYTPDALITPQQTTFTNVDKYIEQGTQGNINFSYGDSEMILLDPNNRSYMLFENSPADKTRLQIVGVNGDNQIVTRQPVIGLEYINVTGTTNQDNTITYPDGYYFSVPKSCEKIYLSIDGDTPMQVDCSVVNIGMEITIPRLDVENSIADKTITFDKMADDVKTAINTGIKKTVVGYLPSTDGALLGSALSNNITVQNAENSNLVTTNWQKFIANINTLPNTPNKRVRFTLKFERLNGMGETYGGGEITLRQYKNYVEKKLTYQMSGLVFSSGIEYTMDVPITEFTPTSGETDAYSEITEFRVFSYCASTDPNTIKITNMRIVDTAQNEINPNTIYMIPSAQPTETRQFDKYMYINGLWEEM